MYIHVYKKKTRTHKNIPRDYRFFVHGRNLSVSCNEKMPAGVKSNTGVTSKLSTYSQMRVHQSHLLFDRPVDGTYCQATETFFSYPSCTAKFYILYIKIILTLLIIIRMLALFLHFVK